MRNLMRHLTDSLTSGREVLLCRVVATRGSTPQKAGAAMLLTPDGGQIGTLGGGCVEDEVRRKAAGRIGRDGAELYSYVLNHDYAWADGLICGGKMVILAECPRGPGQLAYHQAHLGLLEAGLGFTEAVALDPEKSGASTLGARFLFDHEGAFVASLDGREPAAEIAGRVAPLDQRPRPSESGGVAYLPTMPRIRLIVIGAGHVGQAVAELAARVDFDVWVVDDRPQYANRERLPNARRLIVGPMGIVLRDLDVTPHTYVVIVTRGHGHDQEALQHMAPTVAPYVGLIGSKRKIRLIFDTLLDEGISEEALARVAAPVGLDIGSESVDEIAVSIVAELIARRNLGADAHSARKSALAPRPA
ncbi:XdhC family protein [Planctomyces sp. SH-PL62]|uniref:XdhC family protein n=1 Tax=Planctomyces sp. SH-PL62 TaxID=1636152 RepID=UPI00078DC788|nr:XdhC/CoxI family protein [Planctomyces sp. SH-PL62]AMV38803.1 putative xanthine dehydrogenase subunit A [Planctomyces sp. SH-PL62]